MPKDTSDTTIRTTAPKWPGAEGVGLSLMREALRWSCLPDGQGSMAQQLSCRWLPVSVGTWQPPDADLHL